MSNPALPLNFRMAVWQGDTQHWFDEEMLERIGRAQVFAIDALDPPAKPPSRTWTAERIAALSAPEVRQLLENARRIGDDAVAGLCALALEGGLNLDEGPVKSRPKSDTRRLVSRSVAFGMRGASLANRYWSRSGLTREGNVIFALWADDVRKDKKGARYLLWAPNIDGARPWSDSPGGCERLEHCKRAVTAGTATGLLMYGRRIDGVLPEDRAASVDGIDADAAIALKVQKSGAEFWATWGGGYAAEG